MKREIDNEMTKPKVDRQLKDPSEKYFQEGRMCNTNWLNAKNSQQKLGISDIIFGNRICSRYLSLKYTKLQRPNDLCLCTMIAIRHKLELYLKIPGACTKFFNI